MPPPLLELTGLTVAAPGGVPLAQVDLEIDLGETALLVGPSGAGKTLLARTLVGLLPDGFEVIAGRLRLDNRTVPWPETPLLRGKGILYLPQGASAALHPLLTIRRQLSETSAAQEGEMAAALASLGLEPAARFLQARPSSLSGGECQRVLAALALLIRPRLAIFDEPTAGLDAGSRKRLLDRLAMAAGKEIGALLFITHDRRLVPSPTGRITRLEQGGRLFPVV